MDLVYYDGDIINIFNANSVPNVAVVSNIGGVCENSSVSFCGCNICSKTSKCRQRMRTAFLGELLRWLCVYILLLLFTVVFEKDF